MARRVIYIILIMIFLMNILSQTLWAQENHSFDNEKIDKFIKDYLARNGLPGASIVIVKNGEVQYKQGYGNDSNGKSITERSPMRIGSVSKSFTSLAVLQLIEKRKVNLDDKIVEHIPEVKMNDSRWSNVTIRQLLSHTSGLPNPTIVKPADNLQESVDRLNDWELKSTPGKHHAYSNANYWVLAYLVEKVSKEPFKKYMNKNVFRPVNMKNSFIISNSEHSSEQLPKGHVTAYGQAIPWDEMTRMDLGAGGVVTTAEDMGKWLAMQTNNGVSSSNQRVISRKLLNESQSAQPGSGRYGLGWSLNYDNDNLKRIKHSGVDTGYQAQQDIDTDSGYAIAVLLNSNTSTYEHAYDLSSGVIKLVKNKKPEVSQPIPTIVDYVIGTITLIYFSLGIRRIIKVKDQANKHFYSSMLLFYLNFIPQLAAILGIGWFLFYVPTIQSNSSTTLDIFGIYPALMILLATIFAIEITLVTVKVYYRKKLNSKRKE